MPLPAHIYEARLLTAPNAFSWLVMEHLEYCLVLFMFVCFCPVLFILFLYLPCHAYIVHLYISVVACVRGVLLCVLTSS